MRDILDEAIGASPPTRIDIDAVIARRRRVSVLRSLATITAAGAVAAAVVTAAVAVNAPNPGPGLGRPGGSGNQRSATATPPPTPAALPSRGPQTTNEVQLRLSTSLTGQLTAALTAVKIDDRRTKTAGLRVYPRQDGPDPGYVATVRLTTAAGSGTFTSLSAHRTEAAPTPTPSGPITTRPDPPTTCEEFWAGSQTASANPSDRQCRTSVGPDGQVVLATMDKFDDRAIRYEVVVLWADAYVDVTLENYFEGWENEGDPPDQTYLPAPQLTMEQLGTLAENPSLGV